MSRNKANLSKDQNPSALKAKPISPKMTQYVGFFAVSYVLASVIFMLIQTKLTLNPHLVTVLSILVAAYIAVLKFIKHHRRAMNSSEVNRLAFGSIASVWLLTAVYLLGLWFFLFDDASREVLKEMTIQQPMPLLSALMLMLVLTLVSARIGIWVFNRLLAPK